VGAGVADRLRAQFRAPGGRLHQGLETGTPALPDFRDALRTQYVCDAVLASAKGGKWVNVEKA